MFAKLSNKSCVERVLVITLTNIGDVVLTWPVIDAIKYMFPKADVSVVVGCGAQSLFEGNPNLKQIFSYDKHLDWSKKMEWIKSLRREKYDLIVDLRNSVMPFLLRGRVKTAPLLIKQNVHMRRKHLNRLASVCANVPFDPPKGMSYVLTDALTQRADVLLNGLRDFVVVAPGAKAGEKRWSLDRFGEVCRWLLDRGERVVFLGDGRDAALVDDLISRVSSSDMINLAGKTQLNEMPALLKRAKCALVNDSGIMHLASYVDCPVVALFGPTDPALYGPWGKQGKVIHRGESIDAIQTQDVIEVLRPCL